jgi:predicted secreted protein
MPVALGGSASSTARKANVLLLAAATYGYLGYGVLGLKVEGPQLLHSTAGSEFVVSLDAVPTSGYEWRLAADETNETNAKAVELLDVQWQAASPSHGGGATCVFRFRAGGPGVVELHFTYQRRWEPQPVAERAVRVLIEEETAKQ